MNTTQRCTKTQLINNNNVKHELSAALSNSNFHTVSEHHGINVMIGNPDVVSHGNIKCVTECCAIIIVIY